MNSLDGQSLSDSYTPPEIGKGKEVKSTEAKKNFLETKDQLLESVPSLNDTSYGQFCNGSILEVNEKASVERAKSRKETDSVTSSEEKVEAKENMERRALEKTTLSKVLNKSVEEEKSVRQSKKEPIRKQKSKKKDRKTYKGALSLLIQYDSDSASSAGGLGTESDETSSNRSSPLSPLSTGTLELSQPCDNETAPSTAAKNSYDQKTKKSPSPLTNGNLSPGVAQEPKSTSAKGLTKRRIPVSDTPQDIKKTKLNGPGLTVLSSASTTRPFVNLNDTLPSMQQLQSHTSGTVPIATSTIPNYNQGTLQTSFPGHTAYPRPFVVPGQHAPRNGLPYPTTNLGYGHRPGHYGPAIPPNCYPPAGQVIAPPPGYYTWRNNYPPLANRYPCPFSGNPGGPGKGY